MWSCAGLDRELRCTAAAGAEYSGAGVALDMIANAETAFVWKAVQARGSLCGHDPRSGRVRQ